MKNIFNKAFNALKNKWIVRTAAVVVIGGIFWQSNTFTYKVGAVDACQALGRTVLSKDPRIEQPGCLWEDNRLYLVFFSLGHELWLDVESGMLFERTYQE